MKAMNEQSRSLHADALLAVMHALSEEHWCATWMEHLEFYLWEAMEQGQSRFVPPMLRYLAEKAEVWWTWPDFQQGMEAMPLDEWRTRYSAWKQKNPGSTLQGVDYE